MMEAETDPEVVTLAVGGSGFRAEARNVGGAGTDAGLSCDKQRDGFTRGAVARTVLMKPLTANAQ